MNGDQLGKVQLLLEQAKAAHIPYEAEALGGAYDEQWAHWYADYILNNGFHELTGTPADSLDTDRLAQLLSEADAFHQANAPTDYWPPHYARYLLSNLSPVTD